MQNSGAIIFFNNANARIFLVVRAVDILTRRAFMRPNKVPSTFRAPSRPCRCRRLAFVRSTHEPAVGSPARRRPGKTWSPRAKRPTIADSVPLVNNNLSWGKRGRRNQHEENTQQKQHGGPAGERATT